MNNTKSWTPSTEIVTAHAVREVPLMTEHLKNRKVFLTGTINQEAAESIVSQLLYLDTSKEPIHLLINSGGGSVSDGLMIYDILQGLSCPVEIYCLGMAGSMSAVLFASGQKGHRHILPHAKTMLHEPLIPGGMGGSATSISRISESILETKRIINELLAKHTGKTIEEINSATSFDNYLNAEESVKFGLCDDVIERMKW